MSLEPLDGNAAAGLLGEIFRIVTASGRYWLDLRGVACLEL